MPDLREPEDDDLSATKVAIRELRHLMRRAQQALRIGAVVEPPHSAEAQIYPQVQENFWAPGVIAFRSTRQPNLIAGALLQLSPKPEAREGNV